MLLLLRAEHLSVTSKKADKVKEAYDEAIVAAARLGFQHNQALANERAGIYCLHEGDRYWAATYLSRARGLYIIWGAKAKVKHLSEKYKQLLEDSSETVVTDACTCELLSRSRRDMLSSDHRKSLSLSEEFSENSRTAASHESTSEATPSLQLRSTL